MPINDEDTRRRVKLVRLAFSDRDDDGKREPAKNYAARVGIEATTYNNFEKTQRLGLDNAVRLVEHFEGLTLDFIYLGDRSALPVSMQRDLNRAEAELSSLESGRPLRTKVKTGRSGRRSPSSRASTISRA